MKTIFLIAVLALVAGFSKPANATIVVSSVPAVAQVLISTPTAPAVTIVRSCRLCNDTATAMCVQFASNDIAGASSIKTMLCAAANSCSDMPSVSQPGSIGNLLAGFLGEEFRVTGAFTVVGSTPAAAAAGGAVVSCDYIKPIR